MGSNTTNVILIVYYENDRNKENKYFEFKKNIKKV